MGDIHVSMAYPVWHEHKVFDPPNVLICEVYFKGPAVWYALCLLNNLATKEKLLVRIC